MLDVRLKRPLAVFDIEATGVSPRADRIIDIAVTRILPDGSMNSRSWRVNPGIPIPMETTAIHGISDADVEDSPPFGEIAQELYDFLENCDLAGFNIGRFDVPMLVEEFARVGMSFDTEERSLVDAQRIFHRREPRDLTAALAFYCNELHLDAHGAKADVEATVRILEAQFKRYADLPRQVEEIEDYCFPRDPTWVDKQGKLRWLNGEVAINFGKRKGTPLRHIVDTDPGFINWMLRSDFPRDTRDILEAAVRGEWPSRPDPVQEDDEA